MRRRGERPPREKGEEEAKNVGRKVEQGGEEYQCTGVLELDLPALCARAGIAPAPPVTTRPPPSFPADEEPPEAAPARPLARVEVERERDDPRGTRALFLRGWTLDEAALGVLGRCLAVLAGLEAVHFWKVELSERLLPGLAELLARCPRLRTLSLEGAPLSDAAFPLLMGGDATLRHLSLRCSALGDAGARSLGGHLAGARRLVSLVLSFNRISDAGAGAIAEGLRLNRSLLSLSLANNDIGDAGATQLAQVLAPFALTHAELVERRRLLLAQTLKETQGHSQSPPSQRSQQGTPDKLGKAPSKKKEPPRKEEGRQPKKPPEPRGARGRDAEPEQEEARAQQPLLDEARPGHGTLELPGNRALLNLNLSHNRVTERGLGAFVAALEQQRQERRVTAVGQRGLLRLALEKNRIPPASPTLRRLQELLPPLEPPLSASHPQQEPEQELGGGP